MLLTFGDTEALSHRKRTRQGILLGEMGRVVQMALLAPGEPRYPKAGRPGRKPYPLATMLRVLTRMYVVDRCPDTGRVL